MPTIAKKFLPLLLIRVKIKFLLEMFWEKFKFGTLRNKRTFPLLMDIRIESVVCCGKTWSFLGLRTKRSIFWTQEWTILLLRVTSLILKKYVDLKWAIINSFSLLEAMTIRSWYGLWRVTCIWWRENTKLE